MFLHLDHIRAELVLGTIDGVRFAIGVVTPEFLVTAGQRVDRVCIR